MIKGVTQVHLGPIWYYSEPSYIPYFPNQFLGWDFWRFLRQDGSSTETSLILKFVFSKKATKIDEIFTINFVVFVKSTVKISSIFVAFLENMNFLLSFLKEIFHLYFFPELVL